MKDNVRSPTRPTTRVGLVWPFLFLAGVTGVFLQGMSSDVRAPNKSILLRAIAGDLATSSVCRGLLMREVDRNSGNTGVGVIQRRGAKGRTE